MRVFLAGATGVIGRRVLPLLLASGHDVTAVGRSPDKRAQLAALGATPADVELFDARAVRRVVAGHDVVINLATHIPKSSRAFLPRAWRENDRVRRVASTNLASAALLAGAERYIQESFAPIYPDRGDEWIDERTAPTPARYNAAVMDAEAAAARVSGEGATGVVLRFAYFYGPDSDFTLDTIKAVRRGIAPVLGSPEGYISSITHDDAAAAVVAALGAPAGTYNVVDDEPLRRREFIAALANALGAPTPRFLPEWLARVTGSLGETLSRSQRISNAKLKQATGWAPASASVREGWRDVVATSA